MPEKKLPLLIIGSSPTWFDDLLAVHELVDDYDVCCVNRALLWVPCIILQDPNYFYSYHDDFLQDARRAKILWHSCNRYGDATFIPLLTEDGKEDWAGSSGLQATKIAIKHWKYDKIILCGISLTPPYDKIFYKAWTKAFPILKDKVRSMAGKTKELLGEPTKEWLDGTQE